MRNTIMKAWIPAALLALGAAGAMPGAHAAVSIGISVNIAPPPLPVYVQPPLPAPGYIWTPGYWSYADNDYFWVPGTWVEPPEAGFLWTPGYWGWSDDGAYLWHAGYWGSHVGFYGGVDYGYGYTGNGFAGGYWRGHDFYYNRAVANVRGPNIHNVYNRTVINNITVNRVSYNGGSGGINAHASAAQARAEHDRHIAFTSVQEHHQQAAAGDRELRSSVNHGRPAVAATAHAGNFTGGGTVAARAAGSTAARPGRPAGIVDHTPAHPAPGARASGVERPGTATNAGAPEHRETVHEQPHVQAVPRGMQQRTAAPEHVQAQTHLETHEPHMTRPPQPQESHVQESHVQESHVQDHVQESHTQQGHAQEGHAPAAHTQEARPQGGARPPEHRGGPAPNGDEKH